MSTTDQLKAALDGRYGIDRLIGEGGMATVYLARDVRHNRRVALKVLKPDLGAVVGSERFLSEIQVTANLQHPNLLPLFDSGAADHLLFYVMPYIEGESLRARLDREKQLPVEEAVRIATAVSSALDYAHRQGVIHRDLKPENILLHEGQPLVADFGIALAVSNAGGNRITQTGLSLGTPQYMSPEQATGDRAVDGRTDTYSLGALTYEMLTGEPPHVGATSQAIIARLLTEKPRSIRSSRPSVPEQVEVAVERALEKLPADRWATAKEFGEALSGARVVARSTSTTVPNASAITAPGRRPSVRELVAWGIATVAVGTAVFAMVPEPASQTAVPAEFEIAIPEELDVNIPSGGANTIALSQDGSTLVFLASRAGARASLYARRLGDRDVLPIRGSDSIGSPTLSPDGQNVVFPARGGRGTWPMKMLPLRGGTPFTVVDSGPGNGQVSWGDGGKLVLAYDLRLWTAPAQGGPRTLLAAPDSARRHYRYGFPQVLPGGKAALITIFFGRSDLDSTVLGTVSIPDGKVTELGIRGTNPFYSGTGHVVYATSDAWIFAVPFSLKSLEVIGDPLPVVEGVYMGRGGAAGFSVARNGTLAYRTGTVREGQRQTLVMVDRTGTERVLDSSATNYGNPRVSPDGKQIAFTTYAVGAGMLGSFPDIWRFDTTSKVRTRVTVDSAAGYPSWSPDGERIAYIRPIAANDPGDTVVMSQSLYRTATATPILQIGQPIASFDYSRSNTYSSFRVGRGPNPFDIWLVHSDSLTAPRPFLAEAYSETAPAMSPDGRLLAYVTDRTGRTEVYIRRVPSGTEEVQVSVDGGGEPVWAPNGRELFYRSGILGPQYLMSAHVSDGGRLTVSRRDTLFLNVYTGNPNRSGYDVFPDGRSFVMVRSTAGANAAQRSRLVVMFNWHLRSRATEER